MNKKSLVNGVSLKVENRSGFDKSRFNALTTGVGTITPIVKQLIIPNSDVNMRLKISAQLPPLASDAFLRSHLKVEAFWTPLRLCYGGFESFFCGKEVYDPITNTFTRAELPVVSVPDYLEIQKSFSMADMDPQDAVEDFCASSLFDYLGLPIQGDVTPADPHLIIHSNREGAREWTDNGSPAVKTDFDQPFFNAFPFICYSLIYDEYYRNKLVERPLFTPPSSQALQGGELSAPHLFAYNLPYIACGDAIEILLGYSRAVEQYGYSPEPGPAYLGWIGDKLLNGYLCTLRQRNYGDDYFTCATPSAQEGSPIEVSVVNNRFTIQSLRLQNALQEFAEVNNFASPDYIQTLSARYGATLKAGIAQKPVLLGSADFPMYTSGVEQTAQSASQSVNTPFNSVGSRYGRAHAEGTDFVCEFHADEPGYLMVNVTLVPEAQYYQGVDSDMLILNKNAGNLVDIPCALLEHIGNQPINSVEIFAKGGNVVFGYVQRYLAHKLGKPNEVHGLFKGNESLRSFVVQRSFASRPSITSNFLKIQKTDLDNVAAVSAGISNYGVMIDSAVDLYVSEPLSESAIPSLVNPAKEHGRSVYVKTGGSKLA